MQLNPSVSQLCCASSNGVLMAKINWRRGLRRLYLLLVGAWLAICIVLTWSLPWTAAGVLFALAPPTGLLVAYILAIWAFRGFADSADSEPRSLNQRVRVFSLTRTSACLLSLFGPLILIVVMAPFLLLAAKLSEVFPEGTFAGPAWEGMMLVAVLLFFALVFGFRVWFARWYVVDKGRSASLGWLGIFGFWGWVVLWMLSDRRATGVEVATPTGVVSNDGAA